jgi:transcriptional regulator with XRE-family HTH domain
LRKLTDCVYNGNMNKHILNKAIKKAGSQAQLARDLGVSRQLITNIKRGTPAGEHFINSIDKYLSLVKNN